MKNFWVISTTILYVLFLSTVAYPGTTGKISGVIIDKNTGNALPGASIVVKGTLKGAATDLNGYYFISNVRPGSYTLVVSMMGFRRVEITDVKVTIDLTTQIDYEMEPTILQASETVIVHAVRKRIDATITGKSTVITAKEIESLPITDSKSIINMQAGIIEIMGYNNKLPGFETRGIDQTHVRGGRNGEIAYLIDGVYVEDAIYAGMGTIINRVSIQEMKVEIGGFSAEYGEAQSAVVNTITKEGGKSLRLTFETTTSGWADALGKENPISESNALRDFHEVLGSVSGPLPLLANANFFFSGKQSFRRNKVFEFDNITFDDTKIIDLVGDLDNAENQARYDALQEQIDEGIISKYESVEDMAKDEDLRVGDLLETFAFGDYRTAHEYDTFSGWHGFGFNQDWILDGKITFKPLKSMKVNFTNRHTQRRFKSYEFIYQYAEKGQHIRTKRTNEESLTLTHQLSPRTFYELKGYRFWLRQTSYVYGLENERFGPTPGTEINVGDDEMIDLGEAASPDYPRWIGNQGFFTPLEFEMEQKEDEDGNPVLDENGEPILIPVVIERLDEDGNLVSVNSYIGSASRYWTNSYQQTIGFKVSMQSQVTKEHEIKSGFEFKTTDIFFKEVQLPWFAYPYTELYNEKPAEASFYLQDVITFNRVNVKLGGRVDYANSKGRFFDDPSDPTSNIVIGRDKYQISPRLGVGYPVTDKTKVTFNYGHFFQVPEYRNLYVGSTLDFNTGSPLFGNPHIAAQKTVNYEVSLKHLFLDDWTIEIAPWKKDLTGQSGSVRLVGFDSDTSGGNIPLGAWNYATFLNLDHGTARGVDIIIDKSLSNNWFGKINYTWSQAFTNQYYSWSGYWNGITAETQPKREIPAAYDQTHVMTANMGFQTSEKGGIEIFGRKPFSNSLVNLIYNVASGLPYTPVVGSRPADPNSARRPMTFQLDGTFRKDFKFGNNNRFSVFARIINIMDRLNPLTVYSATGKPDLPQKGSPGTSTFFNRPHYYGARRTIDLGVRLSF